MNFTKNFIYENIETLKKVKNDTMVQMVKILKNCKKKNGRLFLIGVGGSAGHCSHSVNDFRKICNIQAFTPVDNVSELTARINDEGWENSYKNFLKCSKFSKKDVLFVYSFGGGSKKKKISVNLIQAIDYAIYKKGKILSIVGKKDGYAAKKSNCSVIFDIKNQSLTTPITEGLTSVIWHLLVSHPLIKENETKWESTK